MVLEESLNILIIKYLMKIELEILEMIEINQCLMNVLKH